MGDEQVWDDQAREDLKAELRSSILGELRLGKLDHDSILQNCDEVYIEDAPETEKEEFIRFSAAELERMVAQLEAERETWPEETDCDRLDRVELALQGRGIVLWQASPCCNSCTRSEFRDRIVMIEDRDPGFLGKCRGYAYFIDQNMPESLAIDSNISVYLCYSWLSPDEAEVADDVCQEYALGIGREVCQCLHDEGFEVDWGGDPSRTIRLSLNWQRRTMLR